MGTPGAQVLDLAPLAACTMSREAEVVVRSRWHHVVGLLAAFALVGGIRTWSAGRAVMRYSAGRPLESGRGCT